MRIVQCISAFSNSGTTRVVVDLCNCLSKNHEVYIVTMFSLSRFFHALERVDKKIKIISLDKKNRYDIRIPFKLIKTIRRIAPDIVHLHGNNVVQIALPAMALMRRSKWFFTFHSVARYETGSFIQRKLLCAWMKLKLFTPVANAEIVRQSINSEYGMSCILLPNGRAFVQEELESENVRVEISQYRKSDRDVVFVCVSNITHVKNHIVLCKAFSKLCNNYNYLRLLLIGKELDDNIISEIRLLHNENIYILGERKQVLPYLNYSDAFCLTSLTESGPMVLLESFFAGTIPICTPAGDIPNKLHHRVNGLLASDFSVEAYTEVMEEFLQMSDESRHKMREKSRESVKNYRIEHIASMALQMYAQ